jgi:hypothetical protein
MLESWLMPVRQAISNLIDQQDGTPSHFLTKGLCRSLYIRIPAGPTADQPSALARTIQEWCIFARIMTGEINKIRQGEPTHTLFLPTVLGTAPII